MGFRVPVTLIPAMLKTMFNLKKLVQKINLPAQNKDPAILE